MSKSKEQCLNIIAQQFLDKNVKLNSDEFISALEKSIKEISGSEYSLVWTYNKKNNILKTNETVLSMNDSILKTVLLSKKVFFENHVQSHKRYNKVIDNPLNIDIKSILIAPILDQGKRNVIGFISAFSSMNSGYEFQRYDTRSIALLDKHAREVIIKLSKDDSEIKKEKEVKKVLEETKQKVEPKKQNVKTKRTASVAKKPVRKTKSDLEHTLKIQENKLNELQDLLALKDKELAKLREPKKDIILIDANPVETPKEINELETILNFLMNEVSYFTSNHHTLYTFLEMIKYSLHEHKLLELINQELDKSQLINYFSDNLYNNVGIVKRDEEVNVFEAFSSVSNLYSKALSDNQITFNIFINPLLPNKMILDIAKVQSIIVHLLNNVKGLNIQHGVAELSIDFVEKEESLLVSVKGVHPKEAKKVSSFFSFKSSPNKLSINSTGVGLSISSKLINILGGKLKLTTERENEHSFSAVIPVKRMNVVEKKKIFKSKQPLKIGILLSDENQYAYVNLSKYLEAFSIEKSNVLIVNNYKKLNRIKLSHLICFENMLSQNIDMNKFSSVIILKYSDNDLLNYNKNNKVHEFYINSYYGMFLQKILFPDSKVEEFKANTLLIEDTFWRKLSNKIKA